MNIIEGFILGIIQGLTEFLPVSSSGHLVLFQNFFNVKQAFTFELAVHFATLVAVCIIYYKDIVEMIKKPFSKRVYLIIIATVPAVIAGIFLKEQLKGFFDTGKSLGVGFLFTGLVLLIISKIPVGNKDIKDSKTSDALIIGFAQALALFPAVSRSGMTISASLNRGLKREEASRFSFILSIPVILGAVVMDLYDMIKGSATVTLNINVLPLLIGVIAAGVSGYIAVKFMIRIVNKGKLKYFSYYLFAIATLVLADQLFIGKIFTKLF